MSNLRPPAVPLITVDPYFSIWSFADKLYDDYPRHWTGRRSALTGLIKIDGVSYRFMGKTEPDGVFYYDEPQCINQTELIVRPATTIYKFENESVALEISFMTPLLLDDLKLMSRPISYLSYTVSSVDDNEHDVEIYIDISAEAAVDGSEQSVSFGKTGFSIFCGRGERDILSRSGDDLRIEWGYLHLIAPGHDYMILDADGKKARIAGKSFSEISGDIMVGKRFPSLCCVKEYKLDAKNSINGFVCFGYDDIKSIEYFGKQICAYWRKDGDSFADISRKAAEDYQDICKRVKVFEDDLYKKASGISEKYADILSLAYRQAIAAHKLTHDDGETQFFSKECFSNGCIATVDVTYPSIPLFLIYNPELVCAMLNPVFKYANMKQWEYEFAPHDVGCYPMANGQVYGYDAKTRTMRYSDQMPVEECGNMLLCVAAVCKALGSTDYAKKHMEILNQWADYLVKTGWDPQNQLCTDDFAGHLAHNCNLSIKAILGIGAWGKLLMQLGEGNGQKYLDIASEMSAIWKEKAFDKDHYKLAFDQEGSWSIKYNLVWDSLLDINIFDKDIAETEIKYYMEKFNKYGLPLDSRKDYTKSDWQMWSTVLTNNPAYTTKIIDRMWEMLCHAKPRVPFTDFYYTKAPVQVEFQNRSVQGGLFINLML